MGNAANISAEGVGDLATAISRKTGIDDEAIQSGQNLLLTFGKVRNEAGKGNDVFNQASQLMVDMSTAMGTDAKGAAIQLGKALNDPTKGVTALGRAGVQFSEDQKAAIKTMVETGNTLGAQKIILGEVQKQFGGAAESMATPADKAKVAIGNLKETIGGALLPTVDSATTKFADFVTEMQTGEGTGGKVSDAIKKVTSNLDTIAPALGVVVAGMAAYKVASLAAAAAVALQAAGTTAATGATWSLNAALRANPIGLVVTALTVLAAGLVIAYKKSETFRSIVDGAFSAVKTVGSAMGAAIGVVMDGMKKGFEAVGRAGTWLWNNALQPAFKFIVSGISSILSLWASMLGTLAKVPGFGWAATAAEAMANAAQKASDLAAGIQKIPDKTVNVTVAYRYTGLKSPTRSPEDDPSSYLPRFNAQQQSFSASIPGAASPKESSAVRDEIAALRQDTRDSHKKFAAEIANVRVVLEGGGAGQRAYLRTGRG